MTTIISWSVNISTNRLGFTLQPVRSLDSMRQRWAFIPKLPASWSRRAPALAHAGTSSLLSPPWANLQPLSGRCKLMVMFQMSEVGARDCTNKRAILQSSLFSVHGGRRLQLCNITAGAQWPQLQRWNWVNVVFNTIICELGCSVFHEVSSHRVWSSHWTEAVSGGDDVMAALRKRPCSSAPRVRALTWLWKGVSKWALSQEPVNHNTESWWH